MAVLPALLLAAVLAGRVAGNGAAAGAYDTVWLTPTNESDVGVFRGGMPIGNGDTQVLAWANVSAGGVSFYVSKNDAVASDTSAYVVALVTLSASPNPFTAGPYFNATHDISSASVLVSAGGADAASAAATFVLWVDAGSNTVYVSAAGRAPLAFTATLTPVRPHGYAPYVAPWHCTSVKSDADVVVDPLPAGAFPSPDTLAVLHANADDDVSGGGSYVRAVLQRQGLAQAEGAVQDLWSGRRFGAAVDSTAGGSSASPCALLRRASPLTLASSAPSRCAQLRVSVRSSQGEASDGAWLAALGAQAAAQPAPAPPRAAHEAFWARFWARSYVDIAGAAPAPPPPPSGGGALPLPGACLWLRASSLAARLPSGSAVASWADESGRGTALAQANASRQPVFVADALGPGAPGVVFAEARRTVLANAAAGVGGEATVFAVFKDTGSSGGAPPQGACCSGVVSFPGSWAGLSTVPVDGAAQDDDGLGPAAPGPPMAVFADYQASTLRAPLNVRGRVVQAAAVYGSGGSVALWLDGCLVASGTQSPPPKPSTGGGMVGSRGDDKFARFFEGALGEVLVYPRALNASDVRSVAGYLQRAWNASLTPQPASCASAPDTAGFVISQGAAVSRFMNAAQSRRVVPGAPHFPVKFNGLAWTSRRPGAPTACKLPMGPDCRQWGPDNWWQNTRLPYWPMIQAGDWEEHDVVLDYYMRALPLLQARAALLYPNASSVPGAFWQTETAGVFGAYSENDYYNGCGPRPPNLPAWLEDNPYIYLDFFGDGSTGELGLMVLDRFAHDGDVGALTSRLPWLYGAVDFFALHFPARTPAGLVVISPSQACETLWCPWPINPANECVSGDAPTLSVVTRLLERLLAEVPPALVAPPARRAAWAALLAAMPPLPVTPAGELAPAVAWTSPKERNSESVAMYSVHPARHFSVGRALALGVDLAPAVATFYADPHSGGSAGGDNGWHQGGMHAALLGLRNDTFARLLQRATALEALPGYRLPFFSGEDGMGDEPAAEVGSNLQAALYLALIQAGEDAADTIVLLPAWPCAVDVAFKLWAPRNTSVELRWAGGKLVSLAVEPPERAADVRVAPGC